MNRRSRQGSAMLLVLAILALLTVYAFLNSRSLAQLSRELRRTEQQQIQQHQTH